jgi:murein L,D-transpeptidase YcbB/YkuD
MWLAISLALAACVAAPPAEPPAPPVAEVTDDRPEFQRWLDEAHIDYQVPRDGRAILVNIPAFELIAFEDGVPVLRSPVIVGSPANPTPRITTAVSAVRFRPSWRPTPSMVASGEYADYRRPPGPNNPLGLAAIRLEPGLLVYLHDTNNRDLFARDQRALSHGCIRVQRWDEVIAWLLDEELSQVRQWAEGGRTFDQPAPPVPVRLGYFTRFPADDGTIERYPDVYGIADLVSQSPATGPGLAENCEPAA